MQGKPSRKGEISEQQGQDDKELLQGDHEETADWQGGAGKWAEVLHCLWNMPAKKRLEEDEQVNSL